MKLFPKLALTISILLVGATLALSVSFYLAERRSIRTEADQERRALLQNLVHITQESFLTNDDLLLVKYTRWLQKWNPSLVSASVVSPKGEVLAHSEPSQIGKSVNQIPFDTDQTQILVLTQPVHLGSQWVATASADFSELQFETTVQARLEGLRRRLGIIVTGAITAGFLISFILALSWTRPIGDLANAAKQVGQGKYLLDLADTTRRHDELGYLSKTFQTMAEELQELDQMKDDFVSAVTHELRSPLAAIESYLNLINAEIREGISPSAWHTYAERLRVNMQRLTRFVNDLLDVAALDRGKVTLECQRVNLAILIEDIVSFYSAKLAERRLVCKASVSAEFLPDAWGDPDKIRQVLVNLLTNAIKFTPERGAIDIGVKSMSNDDHVLVYVKDSGVGIAPEDRRKIFNKFEQVHSARLTIKGPKGTGLGLSICRALVELHGGTLGVESKPGEGSMFFFTLPIASNASEHIRRTQGELV
jgi:signal transduction histidine kinase